MAMDQITPKSKMKHRTVSGFIRYTSKKPEIFNQERGRESFMFTHHSDGKVTFRAHCEIEEPSPTVMRDIIYSVDENFRPMDCHVRLTIGDAFMGSGWFRMVGDPNDGGYIECESYGPSIGRVSQKRPMNGSFDGFGTHPIVGDGYLTRCMDVSKGPHKRPIRCLLPSPDHRGATPPMVAEVNMFLEYVGDETVTVAAGTFKCHQRRRASCLRHVDHGR
jgi:hypothetical protein